MGGMALAARHALIAGLRDGRSETELTRALASVFRAEPKLGASFLKLVLLHAPRARGIDPSALPAELECRAEQALAEGIVDISFTDAEGRWHAIVELKIYARYGSDQVGRYLRSLRSATHGVVVAVTRDVPTYGESVDDTRWAGSVQWSTLLPGLRQLSPEDRDLAAQWPLSLDVLEEGRDMGFTKAKNELSRPGSAIPLPVSTSRSSLTRCAVRSWTNSVSLWSARTRRRQQPTSPPKGSASSSPSSQRRVSVSRSPQADPNVCGSASGATPTPVSSTSLSMSAARDRTRRTPHSVRRPSRPCTRVLLVVDESQDSIS
jgi:hypothetical protein